jgi:hypothetical protein
MYKTLIIAQKSNYSGGLLRFLKLSRCSLSYNNEFFFLFTDENELQNHEFSGSNIIDLEQLALHQWDFLILPGSGFKNDLSDIFLRLRPNKKLLKIQFILSNSTKFERHLNVNKKFSPDLLVLNNNNGWTSSKIRSFHYKKQLFAYGGIDCNQFKPNLIDLSFNRLYRNSKIKIGGQAHKNPYPLIETLYELDDRYVLYLYGQFDPALIKKYELLIKSKRLVFTGPLSLHGLSQFYNNLDLFVRTEEGGGWANSIAECFASSVPTISTINGCELFADNLNNCIIISDVTVLSIINAIKLIATNNELRFNIIKRSRSDISKYSWNSFYFSIFNNYLDNKFFALYDKSVNSKIRKIVNRNIHDSDKLLLFTNYKNNIFEELFLVNGLKNYSIINILSYHNFKFFLKEIFKFRYFRLKFIFFLKSNTKNFLYTFDINLSYKSNRYKSKFNQLRNKNLYFVSFPKSGRSVIRYNLMLLGIEHDINFTHDGFPYSGYSHDRHDFSVNSRILNYGLDNRIVLLKRDPVSVCMSLYAQIQGRFCDYYTYDGTFPEFLRDEYFGIHQIVKFYNTWDKFATKGNVLIINFEDYLKSKKESIESILSFYKTTTIKQVEETIIHTSKESMKLYESLNFFQKPWLSPRNGFSKFRESTVKYKFNEFDLGYISDVYQKYNFQY